MADKINVLLLGLGRARTCVGMGNRALTNFAKFLRL